MSSGVSCRRETRDESRADESINSNVENYCKNNRKDGDGVAVVSTGHKKKAKLHEMGEQLDIAEHRCNTLKTQLDVMKTLYNSVQEKQEAHRAKEQQEGNRPTQKHLRRNSNPRIKEDLISTTAKLLASNVEYDAEGCKIRKHYSSPKLVRQNSEAIGTDTTNAAVTTINNILNGITTSVNRLSELHTSFEKDRRAITPKCKYSDEYLPSSPNAEHEENYTGVDMVQVISKIQPAIPNAKIIPASNINRSSSGAINTKQRKRSKSRASTSLHKNSSKEIPESNKLSGQSSAIKSTAKPSQKRIKLNSKEEVKTTPSTTNLRPKKPIKRLKQTSKCRLQEIRGRPGPDTKNLVEIYHNVAAKSGSDSEDGHLIKTAEKRKSTIAVPPIILDHVTCCEITDPNQVLSPIAENSYPETMQVAQSSRIMQEYGGSNAHYSRSYQLPTIASKMKQVAKSYIHQYNFRTIPFCVATSTTPSHNIGVNIQQVMNIIKTRQSFNGISPTLAHNIGIAAEKLNSTPYSEIVSTLSSKIVYGRSQCPLKHNINYQQMQEMAKEIPEEPYTEMQYVDLENTPRMHHEIQHNTVWSADPERNNCTCVDPIGLRFQQVASRYRCSSSTLPSREARRHQRMFQRGNRMQQNQMKVENWVEEGQSATVLKEKNLKTVLNNLHDEFEALNKNYEALSKQINNGELLHDNAAIAELARMEKLLNDKEEEIKIVMALYKEVVALKNQVKDLRIKASQASMMIQQQLQQHSHQQQQSQQSMQQYNYQQHQMQCIQPPPGSYQQSYNTQARPISSRIRDHQIKDPMAALHLTKLLKQIQTYQEFYKSGR